MASSFEVVIYQGRTTQYVFTIKNAAGTVVPISDQGDVVRFKIGRGINATPALDLNSVDETAGGSVCSISDYDAGQVTVTVSETDAATLDIGIYDAELILVDESISSPIVDPTLVATLGIVHVIRTMGGNTGKVS